MNGMSRGSIQTDKLEESEYDRNVFNKGSKNKAMEVSDDRGK